MQNSFIIMSRNMCDEKTDCSDVAVGRAEGQPKNRTEKCLFHEKKCVNRMTFAVRTTGRPYGTSARVSPENNF